ncbi:MAG: TonB-dependent receptor, partial [Candidatus Eremiobacteraeota bacterium]|nr:TonB-dependent receptor [Candidatus Eremiobacteraeota bacterium]
MGKPSRRARVACILVVLVIALASACLGAARADDEHDQHHHDHHHAIDVSGKVTANDGTPIAGALIVVSSQDFVKRTHSDARGVFKFKDIPAGTYSLQAAAPGYELITQHPVTIGESDRVLSIVLGAATTNSLTVIGQVRASAGETVSTASAPSVTINAQSAAASGATTVASMVWNQLSVTPVLPLGGGSNATQAFAVRGPDPRETLVDVDGHQVNNGNTGDFDLSLIDPAALQDVQVVYGIAPSSLIGPNTIGGGINILTLQPTITPSSLLRIFGGSYGTFGETIQTTGTDDHVGYAVSLHGTTSSGSVNQTILAPPPG